MPPALRGHAKVALAKTLVFSASNLHFGPEVGVRGRREDADVVGAWMNGIEAMSADVSKAEGKRFPKAAVHKADSRDFGILLAPKSIDAVFTSPPYPNEKDYTRTTRLESVVLGLIKDKAALRVLKKGLLRSNTRGVYKEDGDDVWVANNANIQTIAKQIEERRIELGKDSGFERLYARVTKLYFGGMARHFAEMQPFLKPGAMLGYVVGDQASYLQVMIRTGALLGEIAESLGYEVVSLDLFRTRLATATKSQMREEVLVLRWSGK
jgi:DNA modification methylase